MANVNLQQGGEEALEKLLEEYQIVQEQLKAYASLIDQLQTQKEEMERAKQEIQNSNGKVYLSVGGIIVETTKEKALEDLNNRSEMNNLRLSTTSKQYNELKNKEKEISSKITELYKQQ